jgi:hypothetical protein
MTSRTTAMPRLPRSGHAALAAGALVQASLGAEFVLAGLSKAVDPDYLPQFTAFVQGSPAATGGPLAGLLGSLVLPYSALVARLSELTELGAGLILLLSAVEVGRRRLSGPLGAQHAYEPLAALLSALAAFALGGMSLGIFLIEGGRLPSVSPIYAFGSPIAVELLLVPLTLAIGWLELGRYLALRSSARSTMPAAS